MHEAGGAAERALARSKALAERGELDGALAAAEEAVAIRRQAAGGDMPADPGPARSLGHLAGLLAAHGRLDEALAAAEEAVGVARTRVQRDPGAGPVLADVLGILALCLVALDRTGEALEAAGEAAAVHRSLPGPPSAELAAARAGTLALAAWLHHGCGRDDEAAACAAEGLATLLPAFPRLPIDHAQLLVQLARIHVDACDAAGRAADAALLRAVREALERRAGELASPSPPAQHGADP